MTKFILLLFFLLLLLLLCIGSSMPPPYPHIVSPPLVEHVTDGPLTSGPIILNPPPPCPHDAGPTTARNPSMFLTKVIVCDGAGCKMEWMLWPDDVEVFRNTPFI